MELGPIPLSNYGFWSEVQRFNTRRKVGSSVFPVVFASLHSTSELSKKYVDFLSNLIVLENGVLRAFLSLWLFILPDAIVDVKRNGI